MADISYSVTADTSRLGPQLRADVEHAARQAAGPLDSLAARAGRAGATAADASARMARIERQREAAYNAVRAEHASGLASTVDPAFRASAYAAARQREMIAGAGSYIAAQDAARAGQERAFVYGGTGTGGLGGQVKNAESLRDRLVAINRQTQIYMRLGVAAGAAVAGSWKLAVDAARAYDKRFTEANHSTAATTKAWKDLKKTFQESLEGGVKALDGIVAGLLRGVNAAGRFKDAVISAAVNGGPETVIAEQRDRQAAEDAAFGNRMSLIRLEREAALASVGDDPIAAERVRQRLDRRNLATRLSGQLAAGEIDQAELRERLEGFDEVSAARLASMERDKAARQAEEFHRALTEDRHAFEHMLTFREEYMKEQQQALEEAARKADERRDRERRLFETVSSAEHDVELETQMAREAQLRAQGRNDEADQVRLDAARLAERRRAQQRYGSIMDEALRGDLGSDTAAQIAQRAQDALRAAMAAIDTRYNAERAMLGVDPLGGMARGRDAGQGLAITAGASDVVRGRVFGMPSDRAAQKDQLAEAKKMSKSLERIERNTRTGRGYGP